MPEGIGIKVVEWNAEAVTAVLRQAVMRGVVAATEEVRNEAVRLIQSGPKTGRVYGRHQASAPGEAPASDTGRLVNSITTAFDDVKLTGTVAANTDYAEYLEYGTATMEPRPFLRPALTAKREQVTALITAAIAEALK